MRQMLTLTPASLSKPLIRRDDVPKRANDQVDPGNPYTHWTTWEEALGRAAQGFVKIREEHGPKGLAGFGSEKALTRKPTWSKSSFEQVCTNNVTITRLCHYHPWRA